MRHPPSPDASFQVLLSPSSYYTFWSSSISVRAGTFLHPRRALSLIRSFPYTLFLTLAVYSRSTLYHSTTRPILTSTTSFPTTNSHSYTPDMTDIMAQQGYGLTVPSSRQDVISALLNEYGNSFGRGDGPSALSPVPTERDLPAPPPRSDSLRNKPLPAVQRAEQRMSMKFQLRGEHELPCVGAHCSTGCDHLWSTEGLSW